MLQKFKSKKNGFALIATISIMSLIILIALAMISLASVVTRTSGHSYYIDLARANAKIALYEAVTKLQIKTGIDTVSTAKVSVTNKTSPNRHWVAVYNNRTADDKFLVDHHESPFYLTDSRNDTPLKAAGYLVSGGSMLKGAETEPNPATSYNNTNSIILHHSTKAENIVRAPLSEIGDSRYAYWVSDNSSKVLINQKNPYTTNNAKANASEEELFNANLAQAPFLDHLTLDSKKPFSKHSKSPIERIVTVKTLSNAMEIPFHTIKDSFHSVTAHNQSILSNPMIGGLKTDLTPFLEIGDIKHPSSSDEKKHKLPELLTTTPIIKGEHHNMTSPRYNILKDWSDLKYKLSAKNGPAKLKTQYSKHSFIQYGGDGSFSRRVRDLTKVSQNFIQPIVVETSLGLDFSPYTDSSGVEKLRTHLMPRIILWNPYNVSLEVNNYAAHMRVPYVAGTRFRDGGWLRVYFDSLIRDYKDWGVNMVLKDTIIPPGEVAIFTPSMDDSKGNKIAGRAAQYNALDYSHNVLAANQDPSTTHVLNFYVDTSYGDATTLPAETSANKNVKYGFDNNGNGFHGNWYARGNEYMLFQGVAATPPSPMDRNTLGSDQYICVAHHRAENGGENYYASWYTAGDSQHGANGGTPFREFKNGVADIPHVDDRRPPRLWRRGFRLKWYDETYEANSWQNGYMDGAFSQPLVSNNIRGGLIYSPSALSTRFQKPRDWYCTHQHSHLWYAQAIDSDQLKAFDPPSPIADPGDGFPNVITLFDIPREDTGIYSLAQFQHAQFSYQPWTPTYALGNSYSTYQSDLDATALRKTTSSAQFSVIESGDPKTKNATRWTTNAQPYGGRYGYIANNYMQRATSDDIAGKKHGDEIIIFDFSYELNHFMWDHHFVSNIPYTSAGKIDWKLNDPLALSKLVFSNTPTGLNHVELQEKLNTTPSYPFNHSAEIFTLQGALNVNCDDPNVWEAHLLSLRGKQQPNLSNSDYDDIEESSLYSRSTLPGDTAVDEVEGNRAYGAWSAFRALTDIEVKILAIHIAKEVQNRGVSVSISDFINRRLKPSDGPADQDESLINRMGTLEAAIHQSELNEGLMEEGADGRNFSEDESFTELRALGTKAEEKTYTRTHLPSKYHEPKFKSVGLPGYLSQLDLLTVLAPSLTTRGDTFTVRAYGDARDANGVIMASAYCEAVVQRTVNFIDGTDKPTESVRYYNGTEWVLNKRDDEGDLAEKAGLSKKNHRLGRKYKVVSFKWLNASEI